MNGWQRRRVIGYTYTMISGVTIGPILSGVYTRIHFAGYKLYPRESTCRRLYMYLVSATKLSSVCRPSVAGYKRIQVDRSLICMNFSERPVQ